METGPNHEAPNHEVLDAYFTQVDVQLTDISTDAPLPQRRPVPRRRSVLPLILFLATCASTYYVGEYKYGPTGGFLFAVSLMLILTAHEMGHFIQARRYQVPASWPFFIPMPMSPIGTMGAVIGMKARTGDRKALFDIAITGPLAGLVPALICSVIGLQLSTVAQNIEPGQFVVGSPLIFQWLISLFIAGVDGHSIIDYHPLAFAGWVGIFITALNLIPIGQLDGGHILYSLLRKMAHPIATGLLCLAAILVILSDYAQWTPMILLLFLFGPRHPPTANDDVPLGWQRIVLGWLALFFVPLGFTPTPFLVVG